MDGASSPILVASVPAAASQVEIQRFSEWFGALGRTDYHKLKRVGCPLEVFFHHNVSPFKLSEFHLRIKNNTHNSISWRVSQRCRLSNECFVSISPSKGVIDRNATSMPITTHIVLYHTLTLKHMIYIECTWGDTGTTFYLALGLNVQPVEPTSNLNYWRIKIPMSDQLSVIAPRQGGSVLLCSLCGIEVVMKTWTLGSNDPLPKKFENQLSILLSLSHPNLLRLIGAYSEPGEASLFVEYMMNGSLADFLTRASPPIKNSLSVRCTIALHVARALAYLHSKGKVHTKLTARSVLVDEELHAKLSGLSAVVDAVDEAFIKSRPELAETNREFTRSYNCYQFGLFLWELLSDRPQTEAPFLIPSARSPSPPTTVSPASQASHSDFAPTSPTTVWQSPQIPSTSSPSSEAIYSALYASIDLALLSTYPDYVVLMARCLSHEDSTRPSIGDIVGELTTICDTLHSRTIYDLNLSTNQSLRDEHIQYLPRTLHSLDLACNASITVKCASHLPTTLQSITLARSKSVSELSDAVISSFNETSIFSLHSPNSSQMPDPAPSSPPLTSSPSLTRAKVSKVGVLELPRWLQQNLSLASLSHVSSFPIVEMTLTHATHMTDEYMGLIPRSVTKLELGECNRVTDRGIALLPPQLVSLTLSSSILSCYVSKHLPQSLTELKLGSSLLRLVSDVPLPPALLTLCLGNTALFADFSMLPRSVLKLDLGRSPNFSDADVPKLPPKLTWLSIAEASLLTSKSIPQFPSSLTHLRIAGSSKFGDHLRDEWPAGLLALELPDNTSMTSAHLPFLPRELTRLELSANDHISNDCIPQMPRTLTSMELTDEEMLTEACIPFLPPALLSLNIITPSKCVREIPRRLTSLNLEQCHTLVDGCLSDLPSGLTFLKLCCSRITDAGLLMIPQSLLTLHLINNVYITDKGVRTIPQGLTKLILDDGDGMTPACLKTLPRGLTYLDLPHSILFEVTDELIRDFPPNITELNMERNENLTLAGIVRLPRKLTSLNLASNENLTDSCIKHLPRGLKYLNLSMSDYLSLSCLADLPSCQTVVLPQRLLLNIRDQHVAHLPRQLLFWDLEANQFVTAKAFELLPRSLTSINLSPAMVRGLSDSIAKHIPPLLTELDLSHNTILTDEAISHLPSPLTRLNLYWNTNLTDAAISLLPRGLMYLNLGCNDKLTDACAVGLPRMLLELSIDANANFTDSFITGLPKSLVYLNLTHAYLLTPKCLAHMPPLLTAWEMSPNFLNSIPADLVALIPRHLKKLDLWGNALLNDASLSVLPPHLTFLNASAAAGLTNYAIPSLPATLKSLILEDNRNLEDSSISYLPRGITHLNLASAVRLTENSGRYFPPELLSLDLSANSNVNDTWIHAIPRSIQSLSVQNAKLTVQSLSNLPPNLTSFDMPASLISSITTEIAPLLPRSLTTLNLWCNTQLANVGLRTLPRVTYLNLAQNNVISDSGIALLPPQLTTLILTSNTKITNSSLKDLPKSLTELHLTSAPLTDEGIKDLPRSLKRLHIVKAKVTDNCISELPVNLIQLSATGLSKDALRRHLLRLKFTDYI
jgi:serine/threonine protein kinase